MRDIMDLYSIEQKIEDLLISNKRWPVIVDFSNKNELIKFVEHFSVGDNKFISAGSFCGNDENLKIEDLINQVENNEGNTFLIHLTAYLKLQGKDALTTFFKTILSKSIVGHVVVVSYQCRDFLKFSDVRYVERGQIRIVDGDLDSPSNIYLISPEIKDVFNNTYLGFDKLGKAYDTSDESAIYIETKVKTNIFASSLITIERVRDAYDILCNKDIRISKVPKNYGSQEQWQMLLKKIGNNNLDFLISHLFSSYSQLSLCINRYPEYTDENKWLYFIIMLMVGAEKNTYLSRVFGKIEAYTDIPKMLYRTILEIDYADSDYLQLYRERKEILQNYGKYLNEASDYCKILYAKQKDSIYYLTDLTQIEREKIVEWLNLYGSDYNNEKLRNILLGVFPDLGYYLQDFKFKSELLNSYFSQYKYQKIINKILPDFESVVNEQAVKLGFVSELPPRTQLFDKLDLSKAHVYFVDALGVEYLGFILKKCSELNLSVKVQCGRCELPSLTCFNKDFLDVCKRLNCPVSDIKEIDDIKHHGKDSFDYQKNKLPLYLIKELEIISSIIKTIQVSLLSNEYQKAVIVSDHGASRLAVLHETENIWQMETKGVHSGRCCPKNEINDKPDCAIEESEYWVLANYDRFRGSRKANVEVHGGASIEEVAVPIIEISKKHENIEAFILEEYKCISLAAEEFPTLRIYVGVDVNCGISLRVNGKDYPAKSTGQKYVYEVELDFADKGKYKAEILNGEFVITSNNEFEIKKKGFKIVNLFD